MQRYPHPVATLPVILWLCACDTFAPPPERSSEPSAFPTTPIAITMAPLPLPTVSSGTSSAECVRVDRDGDGFGVLECPAGTSAGAPNPVTDDCDDFDAQRHELQELYVDSDGDGLGSTLQTTWVCQTVAVAGFVNNRLDCGDTDPNQQLWVAQDSDGDSFGGGDTVCGLENNGWVSQGGDCDETDPAINPGVGDDPVYDGVDSNCDSYDVQRFNPDNPDEVLSWQAPPVCPGSVLAIVAIGKSARPPGGTVLQVGNIGTELVSDATLVLREVTATGVVRGTTSITLPELLPGTSVRTERIWLGHYEVTFELLTAVEAVDASAEGGATTDERCLRAQQPFAFSSSKIEPW